MSGDLVLSDHGLRLRIREPGIAWRRVVDDMVLLDVEKSVYHGLNGTGAFVWEGLASGSTVGELIDRLSGAYPDGAEAVAEDVPTFLAALFHAGLIEVLGDEEPPHERAT